MKPTFVLVLLALFVSCGKSGGSGGSSSSGSTQERRQEEQRECRVDSGAHCDVVNRDQPQVDLLESMIDVNVSVTDNEILFRESKTSKARGRSIDCETKVNGGDVYRYNLNGDRLDLFVGGEKLSMSRLNEGNGLTGAWSWKGYGDNRVYMIRSISFISPSRVIIKTHCEN